MIKNSFIALLFFAINFTLVTTNVFSQTDSNWVIDQRVLFQFEKMLYNNWEGTGYNYVATSVRFLGNYNTMSDDYTFKFINNAEAAIGITYNANDKWKIQEDKISASSSANQKFTSDFNFNGTADLKSYFDLSSAYLLGALGMSFIRGELSIQNNPITFRASFIRNEENTFEFGNYFKVGWKGLLDTNITLGVKVENFYRYGKIFWKESYWNLETMTSFQINKLFSSHIILNALLDTKQSKKLQAYEKLTIGFTWKI